MEDFKDLLIEANDYFANDLRENYWKVLIDNEKNGALKVALLDVKGILNSFNRDCNLEDKLIRAAIFEQAIHIVIQRGILEKDKEVASCNIDGVGSETYSLNAAKKDYYLKERISSRTLSLLTMPSVKKIIQIIR